jgi:hypothetical protein
MYNKYSRLTKIHRQHKARARLYYEAVLPWCSQWVWPATGPGHLFIVVELRISHRSLYQTARQPYQDTVYTWSTRSSSAIRSANTSAAGLMIPFQSLSFSGGSGISIRGQVLHRHSAPVGRYTTTSLVTRCAHEKILVALSHSMGRASVSQAEGRRFSTLCSSINPTF